MLFYENRDNNFRIEKSYSLSFAPHIHKQIEIFCCTKGSIEVTCNFQKRLLTENMWMIVLPECEHSYNSTEYTEGIILIFKPMLIPRLSSCFSKTINTPFVFLKDSFIDTCVKRLFNESAKNDEIYRDAGIKGLLYLITSAIFSCCSFTEKISRPEEDTIYKILNYVSENYRSPITLSDAASFTGLNYSYLSRIFKQKIGCSFNKYIHELRAEYASYLLLNTDLTIIDICYKCGFETQRTFNRIFLDIYRCSPSEYRKTK